MVANKKGPNKKAPSFDDIINASRQRRKDQANADKFFGNRNRGADAPASKASNKAASLPGGPLAARAEKRSATSGVKKPRNTIPTGPRARAVNNRRTKETRPVTSQNPPRYSPVVAHESSSDFSIRGRASGPAVVIGNNFAPGTTAEDIQSAFEPVGGTMLNCRVLSNYPSVVAEMTFVEPQGAEAVVASFNNQKADGRILHLRVKQAPLGSIPAGRTQTPNLPKASAFDLMRELADRERRSHRRAEPQIQDGRYGFGEKEERDYNGLSGLYSDTMMLDEPSHRGSRGYR